MLSRLVSTSDNNRFCHVVISLCGLGKYGPALLARGINVFPLDLPKGFPTPFAIKRTLTIIRQFRPDIIQSWLYHADLLVLFVRWFSADARQASWTCNIRCVLTSTSSGSRVTRFVLWLLGRTSDRPVAILANSLSGSAYHSNTFGYHPRRWLIVPNGFDLDAYRPCLSSKFDVRHTLGLSVHSRILIMVARADRLKDHDTFLAALFIVRARDPSIYGVLVGRGATLDNPLISQSISRLNIRDGVLGLGERHDVPSLMAGADLSVLTSISEGFPNVLGESMACGTPCISTSVGAASAIIGDTGLIVPMKDPQALADSIIKLLYEPDSVRQQRRNRARQRICDHYSIAKSVSIYERIYIHLSGRRFHGGARVSACVV